MFRNFHNPLNAAVLHWHRLVQPLGYCFSNQGFFVLLQNRNLLFQICDPMVCHPDLFLHHCLGLL